jgi:DNA-binding MarR family transcriptional regulator
MRLAATLPADKLAEQLHKTLFGVFLVLGRRQAHRLPVGELTLAQLSILKTLQEHGPMRMTALASYERVRTPTMSIGIRRLVNLGLVTRSEDPTDRRSALVRITPHGETVCCESLAPRHAQLVAMLKTLSAKDRAILNEAMSPLERLAGQDRASYCRPAR